MLLQTQQRKVGAGFGVGVLTGSVGVDADVGNIAGMAKKNVYIITFFLSFTIG